MKKFYIVKIRISYCEGLFKFENIEDAALFMKEAYQHKEDNEDPIKITMEIKEENTNELISD